MIEYTGSYTDQYQLTMAQVYYLQGKGDEKSVFDYFFRKIPFDGGYAVFAGLEDLLLALENLTFSPADIEYLNHQGFHPDFLGYLKSFKFRGSVRSFFEGDLVFPLIPVLQIEANIIEAQIVETMLLNILNFQTLIATKASRMRLAAGPERKLIDFGLRRAQGAGGYSASRAAIVGGFDASSNVVAGRDYAIPISGTMAHSLIQSYDDELQAFRDFAKVWPDNCVLLVDTYNTLQSGLPNAIKVGRELEDSGHRLKGIRLDSGDLAYLAKKSRTMLDEAGMEYVKIAASNQLDEHVIKSLLSQKAPIDVFGVGTSLVTARPEAALDGVYKLSVAGEKPRIKLSESTEKITLPGRKQVFRMFDDDGCFRGADAIALADEKLVEVMFHPSDSLQFFVTKEYKKEPLLHEVMAGGRRLKKPRELPEIAKYSSKRLALLPEEYKRFEYPHIYKVGISNTLKEKRDKLISHYKEYQK